MNQLIILFVKRDYLKVYHQQGANLNNSNQIIDFIVGENNNYHEIGNAYLEFDIIVRNPAANFTNASVIILVNIAFAFCFEQGYFSNDGWYGSRRHQICWPS